MAVSYRCGWVQYKNLCSVVFGWRKFAAIPRQRFYSYIPMSKPVKRFYKHTNHIILPLFCILQLLGIFLLLGTVRGCQSWLQDLVGFAAKPRFIIPSFMSLEYKHQNLHCILIFLKRYWRQLPSNFCSVLLKFEALTMVAKVVIAKKCRSWKWDVFFFPLGSVITLDNGIELTMNSMTAAWKCTVLWPDDLKRSTCKKNVITVSLWCGGDTHISFGNQSIQATFNLPSVPLSRMNVTHIATFIKKMLLSHYFCKSTVRLCYNTMSSKKAT